MTGNAALLRFPRAESGAYVQHYRCEIASGKETVATVYRLDCGFLFPPPETLTLPISGLEEGKTYTVSIIPVTAWANEGEPLVYTFSTLAAEQPLTPEESLLFSAQFGEGGTAIDAVSGTALTPTGNPVTSYDEAQGKYIAVFDGSSAFTYAGIEDSYPVLFDSFTFDTYVRIDEVPTAKYVNHFSNQESGGFGFEYYTHKKMDFFISVGGTYYSANVILEPGTWVRLTATYDGKTLILYRNGEKASETSVSGTITAPKVHYLAIGADSGPGACEDYCVCAVGLADVYRTALTAEQVQTIYEAYQH